ncbi:MAG: hypothetical protein RLZZ450_4229 [Pseudomonadota bacterium]|jgi:hypothetical protein
MRAGGVPWATADVGMRKRDAELESLLARGPPERGSKNEPITWLFETETFAPVARVCAGKTQAIVCDHLGTRR